MATDYYDINGRTLLKRITNSYSASKNLGYSDMYYDNMKSHQKVARLSQSKEQIFYLGGTNSGATDIYTQKFSSFNKYSQPQTIVEKGNSGSRTKYLSYYHNIKKWILNVPDKTTIGKDLTVNRDHDTLGRVTKETNNGAVHKYAYSGALLSRYTNPNGHATRYVNYYRGVPSEINYPIGSQTYIPHI